MTRRADSLELAVLGLLHESPMHGYELRKRLNVVLGWGRVLSYGSLYPALKRMLWAGLIAEQVTPPPRAGARRPRIVYELTPVGQKRFTQLMAETGPAAWEDDDFGVRLAFFGRTSTDIRLRILEGRRARLEERLARVRQQLETLRDQDRYAAELVSTARLTRYRCAALPVSGTAREVTDQRISPASAYSLPRMLSSCAQSVSRWACTSRSARMRLVP